MLFDRLGFRFSFHSPKKATYVPIVKMALEDSQNGMEFKLGYTMLPIL